MHASRDMAWIHPLHLLATYLLAYSLGIWTARGGQAARWYLSARNDRRVSTLSFH